MNMVRLLGIECCISELARRDSAYATLLSECRAMKWNGLDWKLIPPDWLMGEAESMDQWSTGMLLSRTRHLVCYAMTICLEMAWWQSRPLGPVSWEVFASYAKLLEGLDNATIRKSRRYRSFCRKGFKVEVWFRGHDGPKKVSWVRVV